MSDGSVLAAGFLHLASCRLRLAAGPWLLVKIKLPEASSQEPEAKQLKPDTD